MELAKGATLEGISDWVSGLLDRWRQPGLGLGIVCDGEVALTEGYGQRREGEPERVDEASLFALASLSKSFVSAGVGRLVQDGLLEWDDRVQTHLPWFQLSDPWVSEHVTVRDLMCNRLGLLPSEGRHRRVACDRRDLLRRMRHQPFRHDFRAQYGYCTDGFTVVGELVEAVTGERWEAFTNRIFWQPLGMEDTNTDHVACRLAVNSCSPHRMIQDRPFAIEWNYESHVATPAGGVNSSIRDITKWLATCAIGGRWGGREIIPSDAFAEITQAHTPERGAFAENELSCVVGSGREGIEDQAYGMGWYIHRYRSHKVLCHSGRIDGFCGFIMMLPEIQFGVIVLANADNVFLPRAVAQALLDWALGREPVDWEERFRAHQIRLNAKLRHENDERFRCDDNAPPAEDFADCCGTFLDRTGFGEARLTLRGDCLQLIVGEQTFRLLPRNANTFLAIPEDREASPQFLASLERDGSGRAIRLTTDQEAVFVRIHDRQKEILDAG